MSNLFLKISIILLFCLTSIIIYNSSADSKFRLVDWKSHTSMFNIRSGCFDSNGSFWAATDGGLFNYNFNNSQFREYRNIGELISLDLKVVRCSPEKDDIYVGTQDGILEIFTSDKNWIHILDIKNSGFSNPGINDISFHNNKVYIAGDFGLTVFDPEKKVFIEDALNLGDFPQNTSVNKILIANNEIWLATDAGIARAYMNMSLSPRNAWLNFSRNEGLPGLEIYDLAVLDDVIYCSTKNAIAKFNGAEFETVVNHEVLNIYPYKGDMYYSSPFFFKTFTKDLLFRSFPDQMTGSIAKETDEGLVIIAFYNNNGFAVFKNGELEHIVPQTPATNTFKSIITDSHGALWACSDGTARGNGYMHFSNNVWTNYTPESFPANGEKIRPSYLINIHSNGNVILSSKGNGLIIAQKSDEWHTFDVYDESNAPFVGNGFTVVGKTAIDRKGSIWLTHFGANSSGPVLLSLDTEGKFRAYQNRITQNQRAFIYLVIDNWGTKWLGSENGHSAGLYYYNENSTPDNPEDDKFGTVTASNSSLLDNNCTALAVDKNGMIWVGTPSGISVIVNPSAVLGSSNLLIRKEIRDLRNVFVNDIMVDALNNKWVATSNGVFVLDPDGVAIDIITKSNSPLLSDNVISLASDRISGRVFFGTRSGLSEATSLSVEPDIQYNVKCYPQPFEPNKDGELIIDGLEADTDIRIVTLNGEHVKTIKVSGKTTVWDGNDSKGKKVESGVYLLLATSASTGNTAVAKIAVINRK